MKFRTSFIACTVSFCGAILAATLPSRFARSASQRGVRALTRGLLPTCS